MSINDQSQLENIAAVRAGICTISAAALITAAPVTKFTVHVGNVALLYMYGEIMVDIAATAVGVSIEHTPTVGTATVLGTNIVADLQGYVAGRMLILPALAGAITATAAGGACPINVMPIYVLRPGALSMNGDAAPATGTVRWVIWWLPIDTGAYVTAP